LPRTDSVDVCPRVSCLVSARRDLDSANSYREDLFRSKVKSERVFYSWKHSYAVLESQEEFIRVVP
jgi:hypothetical protein